LGIKPLISESELLALLTERFGTPVSQIKPIASGQVATGFFFTVNGEEYVIRFTQENLAQTLYKDQYVCSHLLPPHIPSPTFVCVSTDNETTYAITHRVPGKILDAFSDQEYEQLVPSIIETLDHIHQTNIDNTSGFGAFDENGQGLYASWSEFLLNVAEEKEAGDFYGDWHRYFEESFLERDLFDKIYAEMKALLPCCPTERQLVHADYAFSNVLAKDGKITAVLDWANAYFGDFLYDVAWLDFCKPEVDYNGRFQEFYQAQNRVVPNFEERMRCYYCYICLDGFRFCGVTNQKESYQWVRTRILELLDW